MKQYINRAFVYKLTDIPALIIIASGIGVSIFMNTVGRSLWVDEAMLAYSFSKRGLAELVTQPLEYMQSAPVIYLYAAKLLTLVFGNTEAVLRSLSVLSFAGVAVLSSFILKKVFGSRLYLYAGAIIVNINFMLQYSVMFKQYMFEAFVVLLLFVLYYYYREKKLGLPVFAAVMAVSLWAANPAAFFVGAVLVCEGLECIFNKNIKQLGRLVIAGMLTAVCFVIYYLFWLGQTAGDGGMQVYWENSFFPLVPKNMADIKLIAAFVYEIFITFREGRIIMTALCLAALVIGIFRERNIYVCVTALTFLAALTASHLHMFPIADRLWCFAFPLFVILAVYCLDRMSARTFNGHLAAVIVALALVVCCNGILVCRHADNVFMDGEETIPLIDYLQSHVREGEKVYIFTDSICAVQYRIGYDCSRIGGVTEDNIIWGSTTFDKEEAEAEIRLIEAESPCYILASHAPGFRIDRLYEELSKSGSLELMCESHETFLYRYCSSVSDSRAAAVCDISNRSDEDGVCSFDFVLKNTGDSILGHRFDDLRVASKDRPDLDTPVYKGLKPGETIEVPVCFEWGDDTQVEVRLRDGAEDWFENRGIPPLLIER